MLKKIVTRAALAIFLLFSPMLAGFIMSWVDVQPLGFVFLDVYPQVFIFFPTGYGELKFTFDITLAFLFWTIVIFISFILTRKLSAINFLLLFVIISIFLVLLVHMILSKMGCSYTIYSV